MAKHHFDAQDLKNIDRQKARAATSAAERLDIAYGFHLRIERLEEEAKTTTDPRELRAIALDIDFVKTEARMTGFGLREIRASEKLHWAAFHDRRAAELAALRGAA